MLLQSTMLWWVVCHTNSNQESSYVTNRRSVSYFASGGGSYSPSGVKVLKFNLTGDQVLDPSTFRVMVQLNSKGYVTAENHLVWVQPLSWNPAVFFRRVRLICGGQVIEDKNNSNRLSIMVQSPQTDEKRMRIASEGFGTMDLYPGDGAEDNRNVHNIAHAENSGLVHHSKRVLFMPMFGLFSQDKLLPLRYAPIQIEFELVSNGANAIQVSTKGGRTYTANWDMSDVHCKCDLLTLDNALDNECVSHLLSGKNLPINFSTWHHSHQATGNDSNFSAHINRKFVRLKSMFVNHKGNVTFKECEFFLPSDRKCRTLC